MRTIKKRINRVVLACLIACNLCAAKIIYVDDDAAGANNGTSWENAYVYLQDALADANSAEKPLEIRVAQGIYKSDQGGGQTSGDREATFQLINGVTLVGGYAGAVDPNARDIQLFETILSGDLNSNDVQVADIFDLLYETTRAENSYHVVSTSYCNESTVLDGFIIHAGNANNETVQHVDSGGGGFYNYYSNLMVINCIFMHNSARWDGGGMHNIHSSPLITNCTFEKNLAGTFSGGQGGGMNNSDSEPILTNCIFRSNRAGQGGGINAICCAPTAINCHFIDNSANFGAGIQYKDSNGPEFTSCHFKNNNASRGAGARFINSSPVVKNCIFTNNSANNYGGALAFTNMSSPVLANCTFIANTASHGCAIGCDHALYGPSDVNIINSILWNITEEIWNNDGSLINIAYCNIQSGQDSVYDPCEAIIWGEGNINVDPLFVDQGHWDTNFTRETTDDDFWVDGDYHLKSQSGRWDPNSGSRIIDDVTSPCIDAGDPNTPVGDEPFPNGGRINMGAYGGTREASMSLETGGLSLPNIAYICLNETVPDQSFKVLLESYGCPTTLIKTKNVTATILESCDLVLVADDTYYGHAWTDFNGINAIENSNKPIVGLGYGGYDFFGKFGLSIGSPNGAGNNYNDITVIDPNYSLFSTPYPIDIPQDGMLQLYTETDNVSLYYWPELPETVVAFATENGNPGYYPLAMEQNRYFLWGFTESPDKMTEIGKNLFINTVIWMANAGWENEN